MCVKEKKQRLVRCFFLSTTETDRLATFFHRYLQPDGHKKQVP